MGTRLVAAREPDEMPGASARVAAIQALIPLGLAAVAEVLNDEVVRLAGARHEGAGSGAGVVRWGRQPGSVYLADQKVPVVVRQSWEEGMRSASHEWLRA